jgi:DNA-binding CsgD family transcriptional regulator
VARWDAVDRPLLTGRSGEVDALVGLGRRAVSGWAGALLVFGEAGVGKTALLAEGCHRLAADVDVLWAECLPMSSLAVPFLPLASALREWSVRNDVPVPASFRSGEGTSGWGAVAFDAWLDTACRRRPMLLVVDDLQWADQSSLDALMYVVADSARRRLAVAATVRTDERGTGHLLRRWLADVRRLPGVATLHLDRLNRVATAEQLAGLLGGPTHESLVDDMFAATHGNPYLTVLLTRGLPPDATALPASLPTDLRDAVARAWLMLSAPAQQLTRLVATGGRPRRTDLLGKVAAAVGLADPIVPLLREAVDGRVLDVSADSRYWFVHPLLAEVLHQGLLPEERQTQHAAFAKMLDVPADQIREAGPERIIDLADHHDGAGHAAEAYQWALLGAKAAENAGGATEMLRLLRRALTLWPQVPEPGRSKMDLLIGIRDAAEHAGRYEEELAALEDLLDTLEGSRQPLRRADLLVRRMQLRLFTGRAFFALDDVQAAVAVSADDPNSAEHALALAELATAELWHGLPSGPARTRKALRLARRCRSAKALSYALSATMLMRIMSGSARGVAADTEEAQRSALQAHDYNAFVYATLVGAAALDNPDAVAMFARSRQTLIAMGAPHPHVARLSAAEAQGLLLRGEWQKCIERLRVALGAAPGPSADVVSRLTAAQLACWQGRLAEAHAHLARADEMFAEQTTFRIHPFDAVRAELAIASGDNTRALTTALTGLTADVPSTMIERLVPLAARAAANQAQLLRDQGADAAPAIARLDALRHQYPTVVADIGPSAPVYDAVLHAMQALYDAEVRRGRLDPTAGSAWADAADACHTGQLPWDEAYARWRAAEAYLRDRDTRDRGTAALRQAHRLAVDLQAVPLLDETEALARSARVPLTAPRDQLSVVTAAVSGLTQREREILTHVTAGRTYREIAKALVVSEKTVSAHISNMLRKTGAANRIELAQLARRLTGAAHDTEMPP